MEGGSDGKIATINFGKSATTAIQECATYLNTTANDLMYLGASFSFARSLVHELAHAIVHICQGRGGHYFPGSGIYEGGFAWEESVFGGLLEIFYSEQGDRSKIQVRYARWPCVHAIAQYVETNVGIGIRLAHAEKMMPAAASEPAHSDPQAKAVVGFYFIRNLFNEGFWEREVPLRGLLALRPRAHAWVKVHLLPEEIDALARMYLRAKRRLEKRALAANTLGESKEFKKLCAPWEAFIADWMSNSPR